MLGFDLFGLMPLALQTALTSKPNGLGHKPRKHVPNLNPFTLNLKIVRHKPWTQKPPKQAMPTC